MFCMDDTIVSLVHSMHVCSLIRSVQSCLICMCVAVNEVGKCVISHCHHSADTVCVCECGTSRPSASSSTRREKKGVLMQSEKMLALQICQVKEYACGTSPGVCISNTSYTCIWHVRVCLQAVVCFLRFVWHQIIYPAHAQIIMETAIEKDWGRETKLVCKSSATQDIRVLA
jgi:hypothetical protein